MMRSLGDLLNSTFWEQIFYKLIYVNFNQEIFNSTDEATFQTICNNDYFLNYLVFKDIYSIKCLCANIEGYFALMRNCIPENFYNCGILLESILEYSSKSKNKISLFFKF